MYIECARVSSIHKQMRARMAVTETEFLVFEVKGGVIFNQEDVRP